MLRLPVAMSLIFISVLCHDLGAMECHPLSEKEWAIVTEAVATPAIKDKDGKILGKFRFDKISLRQHLAHYAPIKDENHQGLERKTPIAHEQRSIRSPVEGKTLEYRFALDVNIDYEVLVPVNARLNLNDEWAYWQTWNYETRRKGALYSDTPIPLNVKGKASVTERLDRGWSYIEKGVNILGGTQAYRVKWTDKGVKDIILSGNCNNQPAAWGEETQNGALKFYRDLLYVIADLSSARLSLEDFQSDWKAGTPFRISLIVTDGANDRYHMPRANIRALVKDKNGAGITVPLKAALYPHALPKGYFEGVIPENLKPASIEISGEVVYIDPEGKEKKANAAAVYSPGDGNRAAEKTAIVPETKRPRDKNGRLLETRILFAHYPQLRSPEYIDMVLDSMELANLNVLVGQFHDSALGVGWKSQYAPNISEVKYGGFFDGLAYTLEAAHKRGIETHVVIWPFDVGSGWPKEWKEKMSRFLGAQSNCVNSEEMNRYFGKLAAELVSDYRIDGICLDGIRTTGGCWCDACKNAYREKTGRDLWKDRTEFFPFPEPFTRWQEQLVTARLTAVRDAALKKNDKLIFSNCATLVSSPDLRDRTLYGQPSHIWLKEGKVDLIMPMAYCYNIWEAVVSPSDYLREARAIGKPYAVAPLLDLMVRTGKTIGSVKNRDPKLVIDQIEAAKRLGYESFAFYFASWLSDDIAKALRAGPFQEKAAPRWRE